MGYMGYTHTLQVPVLAFRTETRPALASPALKEKRRTIKDAATTHQVYLEPRMMLLRLTGASSSAVCMCLCVCVRMYICVYVYMCVDLH